MKKKLVITTTLLIAILLVINLLSNDFHFRLDLTEGRQYTLGQSTMGILKNLEEPVTITAYFSENLPANVLKTRKDFQDLLIEYGRRSGQMVQYQFVTPKGDNDQNEAVKNGIQPVLINVREKDQVKQQKAYLGATVALGDKKEVIPFIQPGSAMEYTLSTAIKKISVTNKPVIGFLKGHGEPSLAEVSQLEEQLNILYESREITLSDTSDIPENVKTLAIIRPLDSVPAGHIAKLDAFLARGGRIALALNRVVGDFQSQRGFPNNTGLERWLEAKGIQVDDSFITDSKCGQISVQQQQGFFTFQTRVAFPYIPLIASFADHPISKGLENVLLEFASPIRYSGDSTIKFTPLAFTSDHSNVIKSPIAIDINKQWTEADFPMSRVAVAGVFEGKLSAGARSKIVVITDGDFLVNGPPQQQRKLQPDNVNLFANSIDWLSDETGLISLRTRGVTSRPLDTLEDSTKTILKYTNFLLPILMAVAYGIVRMQQNRIRRFKRMSENYEEA